MALNPKQKRFCQEYLIDSNATQAAIRAGYSAKTAPEMGWENLRKPQIEEYLRQLQDERAKRNEITADRVQREIAAIGFANLTDVISFNDRGMEIKDSSSLSQNTLAALSSVTFTDHPTAGRRVSVKLHDKLTALNMLANQLGMNKVKEQTEDTSAPLVIILNNGNDSPDQGTDADPSEQSPIHSTDSGATIRENS